MKNTNNIAILLGRFQPIHKGHEALIDIMQDNYSDFHVLVGESNELSDRNPYSAKQMVRELRATTKIEHKHVSILKDLTEETDNSNDWSQYLYNAIKAVAKGKDIVFICGEKDKDRTKSWFKDYKDVEVKTITTGISVSATDVRLEYAKIKNMTNVMPSLLPTDKKIFVMGTTGVGKTTLIRKLSKKGFTTAPEFDSDSHDIMTSLETHQFGLEATQGMVAGMKYSHINKSRADIYERSMLDNLFFFDGLALPGAKKLNLQLHKQLSENYDCIYIILHKGWEDIKSQIQGRGRPNEQSDEALDYYKDLHKSYSQLLDKGFDFGRNYGVIVVNNNTDKDVDYILEQLNQKREV